MSDDTNKITKINIVEKDVEGEKHDPVCKKTSNKCPFIPENYKKASSRGLNKCQECGCFGMMDSKGTQFHGPIHASRIVGLGPSKDYKWLLVEFKSQGKEGGTTILPEPFEFPVYINLVAWYYYVTKEPVPKLDEQTASAFQEIRRKCLLKPIV
jgi:hypothetical protein